MEGWLAKGQAQFIPIIKKKGNGRRRQAVGTYEIGNEIFSCGEDGGERVGNL